jgi:D-alanyl-D-alanine carboxypeptidase
MGTGFLATVAAFSLLFTGTAVADDTGVDRGIVQEGLDAMIATGTLQGAQIRMTDGWTRFTTRSGTAEMNNPRLVR